MCNRVEMMNEIEYRDLIFSIVTDTPAINCIAVILLQARQGFISNTSRVSNWLDLAAQPYSVLGVCMYVHGITHHHSFIINHQ